jgi:phage shock protein A
MASQAELTTKVNELTAKVTKVSTETRTLLTKIEELLAVIAAGGNATPELEAAIAVLEAQVDIVDALVPDSPTP